MNKIQDQAEHVYKTYTGELDGFVCPNGDSTYLQLSGKGLSMIIVDFSTIITDKCGCRLKPADAWKECMKDQTSGDHRWLPWNGKGMIAEVKAEQRVMPNGEGWYNAVEIMIISNNCLNQWA